MQYVNDDMDEMFRKAAENYSLDTSSKNWDKVSAALGNKEEKLPAVKNNKGRFLWLLLLLPFTFICNKYFGTIENGILKSRSKDEHIIIVNSDKPKTAAGERNQLIKSHGDDVEKFNDGNELTVIENEKRTSYLSQKETTLIKEISRKSPKIFTSNSIASSEYGLTNSGTSEEVSAFASESSRASFIKYLSSDKIINASTFPLTKAYHKQIVNEETASKKTLNLISKKFYAGIFGGIDATSVKFQKTEKTGFYYGVMLGYQFKKRWSVEAGVFADKKYYYTDAKYFNTSKLYQSPNSKITDISGTCTMFEIPVSIKFDLSSAKKSTWFVTAGLSSYIMKKENYDYTYFYLSSGSSSIHSKTYKNSSKNILSIAQLSAGYSHAIGRFVSLRVEPYLKLPIKGVGYGDLNLLSTGLQIGVTKNLF